MAERAMQKDKGGREGSVEGVRWQRGECGTLEGVRWQRKECEGVRWHGNERVGVRMRFRVKVLRSLRG
jgi:hypothetical protein